MATRRQGLRGLMTLAMLETAAIATYGCDKRVEEPTATTSDAPASATTEPLNTAAPSSMAKPIPELTQAPEAGPACVVPLPEKPERPVLREADPRCPPDPDEGLLAPLKTATLKLEPEGAPTLTVEVADTPASRQRGLMFRTSMAEDRGMLFIFEQPKRNTFWMRNTCISLDMMFIDENGFIVGIAENTPTLSDAPHGVRCNSKFVLEVVGGFTRRHGIEPGQRVRIDTP